MTMFSWRDTGDPWCQRQLSRRTAVRERYSCAGFDRYSGSRCTTLPFQRATVIGNAHIVMALVHHMIKHMFARKVRWGKQTEVGA